MNDLNPSSNNWPWRKSSQARLKKARFFLLALKPSSLWCFYSPPSLFQTTTKQLNHNEHQSSPMSFTYSCLLFRFSFFLFIFDGKNLRIHTQTNTDVDVNDDNDVDDKHEIKDLIRFFVAVTANCRRYIIVIGSTAAAVTAALPQLLLICLETEKTRTSKHF